MGPPDGFTEAKDIDLILFLYFGDDRLHQLFRLFFHFAFQFINGLCLNQIEPSAFYGPHISFDKGLNLNFRFGAEDLSRYFRMASDGFQGDFPFIAAGNKSDGAFDAAFNIAVPAAFRLVEPTDKLVDFKNSEPHKSKIGVRFDCIHVLRGFSGFTVAGDFQAG
ncbi:hypothetical protein D1872_241860 [compost metagenome]